jgi:hypothetical protein
VLVNDLTVKKFVDPQCVRYVEARCVQHDPAPALGILAGVDAVKLDEEAILMARRTFDD